MFEENIQNSTVDSIRQKSRDSFDARAFPAAQDLLRPPPERSGWPKARRRPVWLRKKFWLALILVALGAALIYGVLNFAALAGKIFGGKNPFSFIASFGQLITAGDRKVTGEEEGEINILLLGIGGEGHQGALLTDTMILATIRPGKNGEAQTALLSIPRDYAVKLPVGSDLRKINSAYAYGEMRKAGLGADWAIKSVEDLTGKTIPYYALVDFSGFKQAVDDLGGIDVNVERSFTDSSYPDYRYGYLPTIRFEKGLQHMDGERALQFTRSRHGTNGEGSDFARSRRQELVLAAMKEKIMKLHFASDLRMISKLFSNFADHFKTNLEPWEAKRIYDLTQAVSSDNILTVSLDPQTGLICPEIDQITSAYVLVPCYDKTKEDIRQFAHAVFDVGRLIKESPRIQFQNATKIASLAQRAEASLIPYEAGTTTVNYPGKDQLNTSLIFDLSGGQKPKTLEYLKSKLDAVVSTDYPYPDKLPTPKPDFVVVLGLDVKDKFPELKTLPPITEPAASNAIRLQKKATTTKP